MKKPSSKPFLYVVGKVIDLSENKWEFVGVFDSEEKARLACIKVNYFVGPILLNDAAPDEPVGWDGAYYPHLQ